MNRMSLALILLASGCGRLGDKPAEKQEAVADAPSQNLVIGPMRGYAETNRIVNERLFDAPDTVELASYFEEPATDVASALQPQLRELLGGFDGDGLRTGIKNAEPNAVNMLLWYLAVDGLANDLAGACDGGGLKSTADAALTKLCADPAPEDYQALWRQVMASDAPASEERDWQQFAQTIDAPEPRAKVQQMLVAMMFNPYFLLKQ
jgi:hypothetical protein